MRLQNVILNSFKKTFKFVMIIGFLGIVFIEGLALFNNFSLRKEQISSFLNQAAMDAELTNNWYSLPKNIQTFYSTLDSTKDTSVYEFDIYKNETLIFRSNLHNDQYLNLKTNSSLLPGGSGIKINFLLNIYHAILIILKPLMALAVISFIILLIFLRHLSFIITSALNPLEILIDSLNNNNAENTVDNTSDGIFEFESLKKKIIEYNLKREENEKLKIKNEVSERILKISLQVSHDIRSPLAALKMAISDADSMPEDSRLLISNSIQRINDISNNLLSTNKEGSSIQKPEFIFDIIDSLILEKRMEFRESLDLNFAYHFEINKRIEAKINKVEFQRVLSNLINNSIEAMNGRGSISINTSEGTNETIVISISDTGKGIPKHVLEKLGERGFSYGKNQSNTSGSGLGIYHAKSTIESFNGTFHIESIEDTGTTIVLTLPMIKKITDVNIERSSEIKGDYYDYVYIDDDELMRISWERRANKKNLKIATMSSHEEFSSHLNKVSKTLTKIYIDSDLGINKMRGEDFAKKLYELGYEQLYIASGYEAENFSHLPWLNYSGKVCPF